MAVEPQKVVNLSIQEAIEFALKNNLDLKIESFTPEIRQLDLQKIYDEFGFVVGFKPNLSNNVRATSNSFLTGAAWTISSGYTEAGRMMAINGSGCSAMGAASFSRSAALNFGGADGGGAALSWACAQHVTSRPRAHRSGREFCLCVVFMVVIFRISFREQQRDGEAQACECAPHRVALRHV